MREFVGWLKVDWVRFNLSVSLQNTHQTESSKSVATAQLFKKSKANKQNKKQRAVYNIYHILSCNTQALILFSNCII